MQVAAHDVRVDALSSAVASMPIYERVVPTEDVARTIAHLHSGKAAWLTRAIWELDCNGMDGRNLTNGWTAIKISRRRATGLLRPPSEASPFPH